MYKKYLPSKKFIYILISIILALGIIYFFSFLNRQRDNSTLKTTSTESKTKMQEFLTLDSDNDGLKDWEEALWKTDPKNTDTDGDGTTDGEEARLNRNPMVANTAKIGETPSDQADMEIIAANKKAEEEFAKLSQTDQLSRTFFSQYIASKSASGASISDINKQIILDTAISMTEVSNTPKYSISDVKINNSLSTSTIRDYGNNLGWAFFPKATANIEIKSSDVLEIVNSAIETENEEKLAELDPIIEAYNKTIDQIQLVFTPKDIVNLHLKLMNDFFVLKTSLEDIKTLFTDPARAIIGFSKYQESAIALKEDLQKIKKYFTDSKTTFNNTEYGYILLNII
jgi:hypothetical protein